MLLNPLAERARLPRQDDPENRKLQEGIDQAQRELREAVAGSQRLQEEAARRGQGWLRKYVSVHLSVMNPADVSYRTRRLIGYFPIAPDNIVRDHRKIAFFDLSELDPGKGEALFGGVGVGEQYATATWEDRAVRLRGPAALTLKDAARRYLKANGFTDANIPPPLQPLPKPLDYDERVKALEARGWTAGGRRPAAPLRTRANAYATMSTLRGAEPGGTRAPCPLRPPPGCPATKKWHTGYGAGLLLQLIGTPMAVGGSLASGSEGLKFYFAGGYSF